MTSKFKGYTLGVIAAATYGMNPLFTLPLYKEGMDPKLRPIFPLSHGLADRGRNDKSTPT